MGTLRNHPKLLAEFAKSRNELHSIPSGATGSRMMKPNEQHFLTNAFQRLEEDFKKNPFHIHGETAITGTKNGKITQINYTPKGETGFDLLKGDDYNLHTHPPFHEPCTSSASGADHKVAALSNNEAPAAFKKWDSGR